MLYACPVWSSAAATHIGKLEVIERNVLRIILGASKRDISNKQIYETCNIEPLREVIAQRTKKFFEEKVKNNALTKDIGQIKKKEDYPYKLKHKTIHAAVMI